MAHEPDMIIDDDPFFDNNYKKRKILDLHVETYNGTKIAFSPKASRTLQEYNYIYPCKDCGFFHLFDAMSTAKDETVALVIEYAEELSGDRFRYTSQALLSPPSF